MAAVTIELFDAWWTLKKSDEPQDVKSVTKQLKEAEYEAVVGAFSGAMAERIHSLVLVQPDIEF